MVPRAAGERHPTLQTRGNSTTSKLPILMPNFLVFGCNCIPRVSVVTVDCDQPETLSVPGEGSSGDPALHENRALSPDENMVYQLPDFKYLHTFHF